jgi:hypothetical protein
MKDIVAKWKRIISICKKIFDIFLYIVAGIVTFFGIMQIPSAIKEGSEDYDELREHGKYAVGTITDWGLGSRGFGYKYSYKVNGKHYEKPSANINSNNLRNGQCYLVIYSTLRPDNSICIVYKPPISKNAKVEDIPIDKDDISFFKQMFGNREEIYWMVIISLLSVGVRKLYIYIKK